MKNIPYFRLKWSKSQGLLTHCSRQVDFPSGQVTFHQARCLPAKSLKDQTKPSTGQAKFESYLFQGQVGLFKFFSGPESIPFSSPKVLNSHIKEYPLSSNPSP